MRPLYLMILLVASSTASSNYHWTQTRIVEPTETHYLGNPVSHYAVSLERVQILSCKTEDAQFDQDQCDELERGGFKFEVKRDLNGDNEIDRAVVAIATVSTGEKLGVLLIFNSMTERNPYVLTSSFSRFSALRETEGGLIWGDCIACDSSYPIVWNESSGEYEIVIPPPLG